MKHPNFFIVGAPKCGTTALATYLKGHPHVFLCEPKEPHYFSFDFNNRYVTTFAEYADLFAAAMPEHAAVGEGSTTYLSSKTAIPEILKSFPESRFIVMLRDPVSLVQSYHAEMMREGQEDTFDFEKAWRLAGQRALGIHVPRTCRDARLLDYPRFGLLGEQVRRVYSLVPSERVKVVFFEDFVASPGNVYRSILAFLSLCDDGRTEFPPVNAGQTLRSARLQTLILQLGGLKRALGIRRGLGIYKRLRALLFKNAHRAPLSDEFRLELRRHYTSDIRELMRLTGRDLEHWLAAAGE